MTRIFFAPNAARSRSYVPVCTTCDSARPLRHERPRGQPGLQAEPLRRTRYGREHGRGSRQVPATPFNTTTPSSRRTAETQSYGIRWRTPQLGVPLVRVSDAPQERDGPRTRVHELV
ncbi:uncharacterized protein PHACADRAFT_262144 [Phanerochaete carnosa HHB-10118-sp]|uniref:Uncharacterized protein n=1 Tax=Phanerochaete carnosa (strain HHB-10118-sp) TaxID=650164 RepID=K5WND9_PHACS|nr:uncharacterized protein PHACADRAFT_262144 [Phanerochaete carnosa HHB-10118-sp]EKM51802.1 hypothetical protein PHACADRAFT_262144 [Phanerochaete carnosa HHB-10118-sp]